PDFAITKFKKLAGGGYFKIANQSLMPALLALGYSSQDADQIMRYVMGTMSLDTIVPKSLSDDTEPVTFRAFLTQHGFGEEDLNEIEDSLPTVFDLSFAFAAWSMPENILESNGITREQASSNPSFNGLMMLGMNRSEISELNRIICGMGTIEGAPNLKEEHLPVFDCANKCGETGIRYIAPEGHIRMMAACQPFITGAISKTINLPNEATTDDIARSYWLSWELGLKANALYRDGCKLSQPLNAKSDATLEDEEDSVEIDAAHDEIATEVVAAADLAMDSHPQVIERIVEKIIERPMRRRLPDTRSSTTHHFNVAGHEGYLTVGMYDTGQPGELFITMSKEGSTIGGLMDSLGTAISVALQYGVPIESLVSKFAYQRFEPQGITTNRDIPFAKSLVDYIFQWMGMQFIDGYREANLPNRSTPATTKADTTRRTSTVKEDNRWSTNTTTEKPLMNPQDSTITSGGEVDKKVDETIEEQMKTVQHLTPGKQIPSEFVLNVTNIESDDMEMEEEMTMQSSLSQSTAQLQGDAPPCPICGAITVRNGTCYKCVNCGESLGCS
ncbi:MAG: vitamin B12-dependent ribonucleotide reductase, partial [Planctomycetota bacterium]|nr:vitamin B12-dependent ribonucleotide reductase [Planctomycetota bacterium]